MPCVYAVYVNVILKSVSFPEAILFERLYFLHGICAYNWPRSFNRDCVAWSYWSFVYHKSDPSQLCGHQKLKMGPMWKDNTTFLKSPGITEWWWLIMKEENNWTWYFVPNCYIYLGSLPIDFFLFMTFYPSSQIILGLKRLPGKKVSSGLEAFFSCNQLHSTQVRNQSGVVYRGP